jgi:hypothetical protein
MALSIPSGAFTSYNEAVTLFTRPATLVYPEKKEQCPNCYLDTMGTRTRSVTIYRDEEVSLRIYYDRKSWVQIGVPINIPDGAIQTICDMTDLPKIEKCKHMIPQYDGIQNYDNNARYERDGPSYPQGFKQNPTKYAVTFWNRING